MRCMSRLPTVISCCFCCFLRAGTVMIGVFSFLTGLIFAPNVHTGFWDLDPVLSFYSSATENGIKFTLGVVSIAYCIVSVLLIVGALCNMPILIGVYQWGALCYCISTVILFFILAMFCFFVHSNGMVAGLLLIGLLILDILSQSTPVQAILLFVIFPEYQRPDAGDRSIDFGWNWSQMTGAIILCIIEKKTNLNIGQVEDISKIKAQKAVSNSTKLISSAIGVMGVLFIIAGVILLFATLWDAVGYMQAFVWLTFLNVVIGIITIVVTGTDCMANSDTCILAEYDWLSGSMILTFATAYVLSWIYFIAVANTYVNDGGE